MKDSVELCQRFGRARQTNSSLISLEERSDRPVQLLQQAKLCQEEIIQKFDPSRIERKFQSEVSVDAQRNKELQLTSILQYDSIAQASMNGRSYSSILNEYRQKTKASMVLKEAFAPYRTYKSQLTYTTTFRSVTASGYGKSKREAHQHAARNLIKKLQQQ
jgi:hypothetical protein